MPKNERKALAAALNTLLASPSFATWRQGTTPDIEQWLRPDAQRRKPAVIVSVAHLDDEERALIPPIPPPSARSERYTSKACADQGIAAVKANAAVDVRYQRLEARDGTLYFVLKAGNGEIVGTSETYTSSSAREGHRGGEGECSGGGGVERRGETP